MESSSKVGPPQKAEGITCLCNPLTELFFTVQNNFILSSFFLKLFWVEHLSSFKAVEPKVIFKGASSAKQANNQTKKVRQYKTGLCETRASWGLCGGTGWDMLLWLTWPVFSSYRLLLKLCTGRQNVQCLPNSFGYLLGDFTWVLVSLPTKWGYKHRPTCLMEEIVLLKDGGSYWRVTCQVLIMRLPQFIEVMVSIFSGVRSVQNFLNGATPTPISPTCHLFLCLLYSAWNPLFILSLLSFTSGWVLRIPSNWIINKSHLEKLHHYSFTWKPFRNDPWEVVVAIAVMGVGAVDKISSSSAVSTL